MAGDFGKPTAGLLTDTTGFIRIVPIQGSPDNSTWCLPVSISGSSGVQPTEDSADGTPGSAPPPVAIQVAGSDGSLLRVLSTDNTGKLNVNATFSGSISGNAAASATGSAVPVAADFLGADNGSGILVGLKATTNGLKVDGSAVTQPVSGTVAVSNFPATQPISGTVTANAGSGTFAVSAASLPLPSGASTSAKQPALGTAGSASADVITVQGIASMTALKVDGSAVTQPVSGTVTANAGSGTFAVSGTVAVSNSFALDASVTGLQVSQASTTSGQKGTLVQGAVTTAAPTYTTAQTNPLSLTTAGALRVDGSAATQPVSGTITANAGSGTMAVSAASLPLPSGASTSAKQPALGTAGSASADVITVQGIASMTALQVQQKPATSGGLGLPFSASVTATKQQVKATAGNVYGWQVINNTAALAYVQVFNLASASVTVGTTVPDYVIACPGNSTTGAGNSIFLDLAISHTVGITIAATTSRTGSTGATCDVLFFFN
jgi:hypothetical protein